MAAAVVDKQPIPSGMWEEVDTTQVRQQPWLQARQDARLLTAAVVSLPSA